MKTLASVATLVIVLGLSGCVAAPALAPAALSAGGDLVKAGTVRLGGATYRTFSLPVATVHQATRATLHDLGFPPPEEKTDEERIVLRAHGFERTVRIDLQPIASSMTQMRVLVRKSMLGKDLATASELVAQTELTLAPELEARRALDRRRSGRGLARLDAAVTPARDAPGPRPPSNPPAGGADTAATPEPRAARSGPPGRSTAPQAA